MENHVVLFPLPVIGHITPMLHLGARLVSHGLAVTFVTTKRSHARVLRVIGDTMCDAADSFRFATIRDDLAAEEQDESNTGINAVWDAIVLMLKLRSEFESLLKEIVDQGSPVSCLIADFLMEWTGSVAAKFGIPKACFWTSSATFLLCLYHSQELFDTGCIPLKAETADEFVPCLEGLPKKLRARELPFSLHVEHPEDPGFKVSKASITENLKSAWVMMNTFSELEAEAVDVMHKMVKHFVPVGPLLPSSALSSATTTETRQVLKWLDSRQENSVLYVAFGTLAGLQSMEQLEELAKGIEASEQNFVWVFRSNLVENKGQDLMAKFQERTSERGLVIPWAPQLQILQHAAVGGFLTHCGWNSIMESIRGGVPMLGWPCMAEQNLNLRFIADTWKIGFKFDSIDSTGICSAILKLMQGEKGKAARMRVMDMNKTALKAVAQGGESNQSLEKFVGSLKNVDATAKIE